jgi:hypothetical protein
MSELVTSKGLKIKLPVQNEACGTLKVIYEGVKVTQVSPNTSSVFINCVLLKYDDYFLIYQKRLFSKKTSLRFYIKFNELNEASLLKLKKSFIKSFLSFTIQKNDISNYLKNDQYYYEIQLPKNNWLTNGQYLKFTLPNNIFK